MGKVTRPGESEPEGLFREASDTAPYGLHHCVELRAHPARSIGLISAESILEEE